MTLTFNLSQDDRTELRSRIGTLSLPAQELAVMPSSELANDAFKQKMEKIALQQLAQTTLKSVDSSRPRAKITHKGEELIDSYVYGPETSGVIEVEDRMEHRQPLRLETNLNGDGGTGVPSSAVEQTPASTTMAVDTPASAVAESAMNETVPTSSTVAPGETSVLSPVVATHPYAEDHFGAGELQSPTVPTGAALNARPAFNLNSLWSGAEGAQPPSASVKDEPEPLGGDDDEAEMELDLGGDEVAGGVGDDDFARFLEGMDEPKSEGMPKSAVGIPPGPPSRRPSESDMGDFEKLPVVWNGDVSFGPLSLILFWVMYANHYF
jgi:Transcription factor S-II (TFIIS), central domain